MINTKANNLEFDIMKINKFISNIQLPNMTIISSTYKLLLKHKIQIVTKFELKLDGPNGS